MNQINIEKNSVKPFLKWVGGKSQLIEDFEKNLPENFENLETYIEPFVGAGAFFFHIKSKYKNFKKFIIADINSELIITYITVRDNVNLLIETLDSLKSEFLSKTKEERKKFYYDVRKKFNILKNKKTNNSKQKIQIAAYMIFLNKTCFNGLYRVNSKNEFNVPMGSYNNPSIFDKDNLINISFLIKDVDIFCADFSMVEKFVDKKSFVYFDPPYRPLKNTSSFTAYSSNGFDDTMQEKLAHFYKQLSSVNAKLMLSNSDSRLSDYKTDFFDNLYNEFSIIRVKANRMVNSKASGRGKINEILIKNY